MKATRPRTTPALPPPNGPILPQMIMAAERFDGHHKRWAHIHTRPGYNTTAIVQFAKHIRPRGGLRGAAPGARGRVQAGGSGVAHFGHIRPSLPSFRTNDPRRPLKTLRRGLCLQAAARSSSGVRLACNGGRQSAGLCAAGGALLRPRRPLNDDERPSGRVQMHRMRGRAADKLPAGGCKQTLARASERASDSRERPDRMKLGRPIARHKRSSSVGLLSIRTITSRPRDQTPAAPVTQARRPAGTRERKTNERRLRHGQRRVTHTPSGVVWVRAGAHRATAPPPSCATWATRDER
jgi:hypothetical protein